MRDEMISYKAEGWGGGYADTPNTLKKIEKIEDNYKVKTTSGILLSYIDNKKIANTLRDDITKLLSLNGISLRDVNSKYGTNLNNISDIVANHSYIAIVCEMCNVDVSFKFSERT